MTFTARCRADRRGTVSARRELEKMAEWAIAQAKEQASKRDDCVRYLASVGYNHEAAFGAADAVAKEGAFLLVAGVLMGRAKELRS